MKRLRRQVTTIALAVPMLLLGAVDTQVLDFGRALDLMETRGDCSGAIQLFEKAALGRGSAIAARALLYEGECRERLRQPGAWKTYRRVIEEFPQEAAVARAAAARLMKLGRSADLPHTRLPVSIRLVARIPVGAQPGALALTPDGSELYVTNAGSATVSVISTATNRVTHTIKVENNPRALGVAPDGSRIYLLHANPSISLIETAGKAVKNVPTGGLVADLAVAPDGSAVFLAMCDAGLKRMDTQTGTVGVVSQQACPWGVAVTPDGKSLYVNYQAGGLGGPPGHDAIGHFDARTGALLNVISGLPNVGGKTLVSPDGERIWAHAMDACVARVYDHVGCPLVPAAMVNVIDARTERLIRSLSPTADFSGDFSFSPDGRWVSWSASTLLLLDAKTLEVAASLPGFGVFQFVFRNPPSRGYAVLPEANAVGVFEIQGTE